MNLNQKQQVAMFRFGVISDMIAGIRLKRGEMERLVEQQSSKRWDIPFSDKTRISSSTIRRWIRTYEKSNRKLESLYPKSRQDKGNSRAIDEETGAAIIQLKKENPILPINMLIEEMYKRNLVDPKTCLYTSTVYRFLNQNDVLNGDTAKVDRRRFEAELPNDIWQSDMMHGPNVFYDGKKRKTYLIAFIDDHSRLIPYAEFFLHENLKAFLECLKVALLTRGLPRKLYVDNGPAFRSKHLEHLTASLGIALVHSRPYVPQGRGKIERFFRTVRTQFLSRIKPATLKGFNLDFDTWLNDKYHRKKHSGTGEVPLKRFSRHVELLRPAPRDLEDHFRICARRRVSKDRVISLDGNAYEAPVALIGEQVELLYHKNQLETIEVKHKGKSYGRLTLLNKGVNTRVKRERSGIDIIVKESNNKPKSGKLPFASKEEA